MKLTEDHYNVLREAKAWGAFFLSDLAADKDHGVDYDDVYDIIYNLIDGQMISYVGRSGDSDSLYTISEDGLEALESRR